MPRIQLVYVYDQFNGYEPFDLEKPSQHVFRNPKADIEVCSVAYARYVAAVKAMLTAEEDMYLTQTTPGSTFVAKFSECRHPRNLHVMDTEGGFYCEADEGTCNCGNNIGR